MEFTFDEKRHRYYLDGKALTGVTSVLNVIAKPALIQWAADMACNYVADNLQNMAGIDAVLAEARSAHRKKKEDAGAKGTDVHAEIEKMIKYAIENDDGFVRSTAVQTTLTPQIEHFLHWSRKSQVKFSASEKRVYSPTMWLAGTLDFVCEIDGKKYIGDLKTSSGIYGRSYFAQCAAYRMMLEEMGETGFEGSVIVRIGKDGKFNEDQDVVVSLNYEDDKRYFLSALEIYRMDKNLFESAK